jgi:4-carboxymuconolactone decarboxylase
MPPRVPLCEPGPHDDLANSIIARRGGWIATLDRVLLHSPPVANGWNIFFGAIRDETVVSPRVRELAMLRVAHLNDDKHNLWHHEPIGKAAGITDAEIDAIHSWPETDCFDDVDRAVLMYADAMTRDRYVPDDVFAGVRDRLTTRELVELTAIIAGYNCVNRFLVAMDIDREV